MSSKRGRKVNKDLPPSRARDVQRAFRARRAAHLEALEERVAVLEQENSLLRAALKLPPSDRPVLGRGPTGKEKPKPLFGSNEHPNSTQLIDTLRHSSVSSSSTETSNRPYLNGDNAFQFPHWDNALMIHQEVPENDSSPPVEGHTPPLKLSPISFYSQPSLPLRHTESSGGVSPGPMHSRSNSYPHSSSSSSAGPDTFSPIYMMSEMPEPSPSVGYSPQHSTTSSTHHHLCPPEPLSHFQYPTSSPSSAGATQQSSPYLSRRESDHLLNISYSRHSPQPRPLESNGGHRRAITEPQSLRALITEPFSGARTDLSASMSAHGIRVPSPPPLPLMDRDTAARKYSTLA